MSDQETTEIFKRSRKNFVLASAVVITLFWFNADVTSLKFFGVAVVGDDAWKAYVWGGTLYFYFWGRYHVSAQEHAPAHPDRVKKQWRSMLADRLKKELRFSDGENAGKKVCLSVDNAFAYPSGTGYKVFKCNEINGTRYCLASEDRKLKDDEIVVNVVVPKSFTTKLWFYWVRNANALWEYYLPHALGGVSLLWAMVKVWPALSNAFMGYV